MDDPNDIGQCARCRRWQRRRHAYAEVFGPGDREEWCVTGGCFATWRDGVDVVLRARHDGDDTACTCAACRARANAEPGSDAIEWAADHGAIGAIDAPPGRDHSPSRRHARA
jgi:hypothetical protein